MKASETYKFVERPSSDRYSIEITSGPFAGTIYSYGKVSFRDRNLGVPVLSFQYTVESSSLPKNLLDSLPAFKNLLGDILHDQLELQYTLNDGQSSIPVNNTDKPST